MATLWGPTSRVGILCVTPGRMPSAGEDSGWRAFADSRAWTKQATLGIQADYGATQLLVVMRPRYLKEMSRPVLRHFAPPVVPMAQPLWFGRNE